MASDLTVFVNSIITDKSRIKIQKGEYLFKEGDSNKHLFFLVSGEINVLHKRCKLWTAKSKEIIGLASFFSSASTYNFSAKANVNSQILVIDRSLLTSSISAKPAFSHAIMNMLCERIKLTNLRIKALLETPTKTRLIQEILLRVKKTKCTTLQCSLEELSEIVGVSPRIIRQILTELAAKKMLKYKLGVLNLYDARGLKLIGEIL